METHRWADAASRIQAQVIGEVENVEVERRQSMIGGEENACLPGSGQARPQWPVVREDSGSN